MKTEEDDEFDRIAMENRLKNSGMNCCTYDCTQGRNCPIRREQEVNEKQPQHYSGLIEAISRWFKVK